MNEFIELERPFPWESLHPQGGFGGWGYPPGGGHPTRTPGQGGVYQPPGIAGGHPHPPPHPYPTPYPYIPAIYPLPTPVTGPIGTPTPSPSVSTSGCIGKLAAVTMNNGQTFYMTITSSNPYGTTEGYLSPSMTYTSLQSSNIINIQC